MLERTEHGFISEETMRLSGKYNPADFSTANLRPIAMRLIAVAPELIASAPSILAQSPSEWERIIQLFVTKARVGGEWVGIRYEEFRKMAVDAYARQLDGTPRTGALSKAQTAIELTRMCNAGYLSSDYYGKGTIQGSPEEGGKIFFPTEKLLQKMQVLQPKKVKV